MTTPDRPSAAAIAQALMITRTIAKEDVPAVSAYCAAVLEDARAIDAARPAEAGEHEAVLREMLATDYAVDESVGMRGFALERAAIEAALQALAAAKGGESIPVAELVALLPGSYYMDPPDGGDVCVLEQLRRMAADATRHRLAAAPAAPAVGDGLVGYMAQCEIDSQRAYRAEGNNAHGGIWAKPTGQAGVPVYTTQRGPGGRDHDR